MGMVDKNIHFPAALGSGHRRTPKRLPEPTASRRPAEIAARLPEREGGGASDGAAPPDRVLLVDDDRATLAELAEYLSAKGFDCETASDGEMALARILGDPGISVVVTDIGMPNLDGITLARCLRDEALSDRDLKVIFITGRRGAEEPVRGLRVGGFDFLNKPVRLGELHQAVRRAAEAVRNARLARAAKADLRRAAKAELRREIAEQRRKLAATTQVKDAFLSMMSHELRTPFNAIIGFSELLLDRPAGANDATAIEFVGHILAAARQLQGHIDTILDLVAVESETLELRKTDVPVAGLIDRALGAYRPELEAEAIDLELDIVPPALTARADPERLARALGHLIGNAIKFSPRGGTIRLRARGADGAVHIAIADAGEGMTPDQLAAAWEPFRQVDAGLSRHAEGIGLGLTLARHLVEAHGGALEVETGPGAGTTVTIRLPQGDTPDGRRSAADVATEGTSP